MRSATAARSPADAPGLPRPDRTPSGLAAGSRRSGDPPGPAQKERAWGSRPGRLGPITVVFGALAGGFLTVLADSEPGWLLGLSVIIATAVGTTAVRRTSTYLVIPVPALAYFVVAVIAGLIHDRAVDTSRAILLVNAVQWSADGFPWMFLATVIVIAITIGRWLMTGRAGYRAGGYSLARLSRAWSATDATRRRTGPPRPSTARPDTTQSGPGRSASARPATRTPEDAPSEDASTEPIATRRSAIDARGADVGRTQPMPRQAVDTEHSTEG